MVDRLARLLAVLAALAWCAACAGAPARLALPRVPWSSCDQTLAAIAAWPDGRSDAAPWAFLVAIPEELADRDFDRIHAAIRARGRVAVVRIQRGTRRLR